MFGIWLHPCHCKQDMALKWLIWTTLLEALLLSPVWKQSVLTIKWFLLRRGNSHHWLDGCFLHSEWCHLVSVWAVRSRRSRVHGQVPLPSWWCWGPSVVWRPPLFWWSFSEPHTHPCTVHLGPAAGSASLSVKNKDVLGLGDIRLQPRPKPHILLWYGFCNSPFTVINVYAYQK